MSVIDRLATALNERKQISNQELAREIVEQKNDATIKDLVDNLKNKSIQGDCIKVLYEIGGISPSLISNYIDEFINQLSSKNNRMQWGAMTAINTIALENPSVVYNSLGKMIAVAEKGSVITTDNLVGILIKLYSLNEYREDVFPLILEQLSTCPTNQLPMYAEQFLLGIHEQHYRDFITTLSSRLNEVDKESKRKRIEKVIQKLNKK